MLANRRAVRPDGKHYRTSRRQRVERAYRLGGTGGTSPAILVLLGIAGGLIYLGVHLGGLWTRMLCFGGAVVAMLLIVPAFFLRR